MTTFRGKPNSAFVAIDGTTTYSGDDGLFQLPAANLQPAIAAGLALVDSEIESQLDAIEARLALLES
jgi:hypothetical protein